MTVDSTQTLTQPDDDYANGIAGFLSEVWGQEVTINGFGRMTGGNARTTWRFHATTPTRRHRMVLRVAAGPALELAEFRREFDALTVAFDAGLPVPEPLWHIEEERWLGASFVLIAEVPNCLSSNHARDLSPGVGHTLFAEGMEVLGRLAAVDLAAVELPSGIEQSSPESCAREQLDAWADLYEANEIHPNPIGRVALQWLRANPPAAASKLALVHGDYRLGNLLYDNDGHLRAVLDWEMAHLGDPLEDLAWTIDVRQDADHPVLAWGVADPAQAVELWQASSGLEVDTDSLRWWQVFVAFKALTIWTMSGHNFATQPQKRLIDGRMGWVLVERQQRILVDLLSPHSEHHYYWHGEH
ncbi:phosphotransferase family protein [Rhodococcus sp. USK10]|uniref:phosphotransferase family protein n=1 Tax=Rhodococcus sp. USK10 TaxID=2789739 RepID=UPI002151A663|nr:phosphotransferase family protein [Rhodococcus sp. USK10]